MNQTDKEFLFEFLDKLTDEEKENLRYHQTNNSPFVLPTVSVDDCGGY